MRPRVICHMATSIDGRIVVDGWPDREAVRREYETVDNSYGADAWMCGRITWQTGKLYRVPVNAGGSAGTVVPIETSLPFVRPDGLRTAGPRTLIQAEGQGSLTELTINGNSAEVRVVQDTLPGATGVTIVGANALVLVSRLKAVVVPYRAVGVSRIPSV